jgi:hypothetical protein
MTMDEKIEIARQAGYDAAANGIKCAPVLCPTFMGLIPGLEIGGSIPLSKAWIAGFQKRLCEGAVPVAQLLA